MNYLLDTNICIYLIKKHPPSVIARFKELSLGQVGISTVTLAELEYGVKKSQAQERNQLALEEFILPLVVLPFDQRAASYYGDLRASLERAGIPIGPLDLMIAAHALSLEITLVSNNTKEFARVSQLRLENWASG
ncbi:MAG: type II toxin-antitoxin system VapC family toxin [Thioploca sp.]|nr:type II toxin-antitoxin system VapC family toxin [Thioploca sp.]